MIEDLEQLNKKYYKIFEELKEARPSLSNCDAAFLSIVQKITEQYEGEYNQLFATDDVPKTNERISKLNRLNERFYALNVRLNANSEKISAEQIGYMQSVLLTEYRTQYELLEKEYAVETAKRMEELQARYDRQAPRYWFKRFLLFFKKPKQNYAADLIEKEEDLHAVESFAKSEARIAELYKKLGIAMEQAFPAYLEGQNETFLESAQAAQENGENAEAEQTDGSARQSAEGAEGEPEQAAETLADKLMKEYRNKTKKKKTEKGAENDNTGNGEST